MPAGRDSVPSIPVVAFRRFALEFARLKHCAKDSATKRHGSDSHKTRELERLELSLYFDVDLTEERKAIVF